MVKLDKHSSLVLAEVVGGPCKEDFMGQVILYCDYSREGPKDNGYEYHPLGAGGGGGISTPNLTFNKKISTFRPRKFKSKRSKAIQSFRQKVPIEGEQFVVSYFIFTIWLQSRVCSVLMQGDTKLAAPCFT